MTDPVATRREALRWLVRGAGLAPPVLAFLEGGPALARNEENDLAILAAAVALEHEAIAIYDFGLERKLCPAGLVTYAVEFRGDHLGHRDTQIALAEERGRRAPQSRNDYDFGRVDSGDAWIRLSLDIEIVALRAYTALVSQIRTNDYLLSAAFILVDEVRHATVWRRVLGLSIY
jgi:Ferritin-like domain